MNRGGRIQRGATGRPGSRISSRNPGRGVGGGRNRGGGGGFRDEGPPAEIVEAGSVAHDCQEYLVVKWEIENKVPYFNAGIYLQNKKRIGKVDEILGKIAEIYFTIKLEDGIPSKSFQPKDTVFIGTDKLLPLERFTNPSSSRQSGGAGRGRGGPGRGNRAGRGGRFSGGGRGRGDGGGGGRFAGRGRFSGRGGGGSPGGRGGPGGARFGAGRGGGGRARGY